MKNNLFHKSLMKKFSDDKKLQINITKHDIIKAHIQKLENRELESEVSNYIYFYDKFLKEILGYDLEENIDHEKRFGRGKVEFSLKKDGEDFMVIELKDQTVDLDKPQHRTNDKRTPVEQAWGYLKDAPSVNWIMVSNFDEFRLYNIEERGKYLCFTADELLDPEIFSYFMIAFSKRSHIEKRYADQIVHETILDERNLEKNFYKLYHETRLMLIRELETEGQLGRLDAIHYAQLILNRYMFICFAEDTGLLPPQISADTISTPIQKGNIRHRSIWQRLNELFWDINEGNLDKEVSEYNGGLFREDLDFIKIRDQVEDQTIFKDTYQNWNFEVYEKDIEHLIGSAKDRINPIYRNLMTISSFDFSSELDVNILGHIFENSIGDIEELKADTKGRRKKEGIFYTPDYITDYICRNTIIPYLSKTGEPNTIPELITEYWGSEIKTLDQKVKDIKIVDPACGSGAFLSKAADILVEIHEAIHEQLYKDNKTLDKHFDTIRERRTILLNNIYGVDLNEESVEITKLSLFLKVCRKDLKLPNLDKNIRCGNSIIDDKEYAGDKAFNWKQEFPEIFQAGGFDIVIGNPPYVRQELIKEIKPYLKDNYKTYNGVADLYVYFFEKGINILLNAGFLGFISSNKFTRARYGISLRKFILNHQFRNYMDYTGKGVFEDAKIDPCVILISKRPPNENEIIVDNEFKIKQNMLSDKNWSFVRPEITKLKEKIEYNGIKIKEFKGLKIFRGILTGFNEAFIIDEERKNELIAADPKSEELIKPLIAGKDVQRWNINFSRKYLIFSRRGINIDNYPAVKEHLIEFKDKLKPRNKGQTIGRKPGDYKWYELQDTTEYYAEFEKSKLVYPYIKSSLFAVYDENQYYPLDTLFTLTSSSIEIRFIGALLSSKLLDFFFKLVGNPLSRTSSSITEKPRYKLNKPSIGEIPIYPATYDEQQPLINYSDYLLELNKKLQNELQGFKHWIAKEFNVEKLSKKLETYYELSDNDFIEELKKKKVDTKSRKNREYLEREFIESLKIIKPLLQEIEKTDDEIDRMVYELYGLSDDEIQIIEDSLKN